MSKPLKNPELPPGAIAATHKEDKDLSKGQVRRNDGEVLNPASENPWYVLATVAGEQEGISFRDIDYYLHAKNRRFWNGWMCQGMDAAERAALAEKLGWDEKRLSPLNPEEMEAVKAEFKKAFPEKEPDETIPNPDEHVDFRNTYFNSNVVLHSFQFNNAAYFQFSRFEGEANFIKANFDRDTIFHEAHFESNAYFQDARFCMEPHFKAAHFCDSAFFQASQFLEGGDFESASFDKPARFQKALFNGVANFMKANFRSVADCEATIFDGNAFFIEANIERAKFQKTHFNGVGNFQDATFKEGASFSDGCFKAKTVFDGAAFKGRVPEFFHREMHQDTSFTEDKTLWPEVTAKNAERGRKAYTRLRQVAAEIYDPDLEHFFLRQEMECKEALAGRFEKALFILYRKLADSGISVKRPAAALAVLWALGAAMFAGYFLAPMGHHVPDTVAASPGWSGIGLSFANVLAFLGLSRAFFSDVLVALPICLKYFAGLQTILGAVFFFLLALGLRNRFRLK